MTLANLLKALGGGRGSPAVKAAPAPFAPPPTRVYVATDGGEGHAEAPWSDVILRLQQQRGSHVIALVHRHLDRREHPWRWYVQELIGQRHLEDFLTAIRAVPSDARLDIVLHSIGAWGIAVQQIARAVKAHKGETTIFVPYYAHDLSTLFVFAADKIVMGPNAALSVISPDDQVLETVVKQKGVRRTQDGTLLRLHMARNDRKEIREFVCELAHGGAHRGTCRLAREMVGGETPSYYPVTPAVARNIGLQVSTEMPGEVFELVGVCRASPAPDKGVKTAPLAPVAASTAWRVDYLAAGRQQFGPGGMAPASADAAQRQAPVAQDEDEDAHEAGVSRDNCNIAVRPFIARMEERRGSRVLCIVHRPTTESLSVDTATAEDVLAAIASIDPQTPLDIVLHTPGGALYEGVQIARAFKAHKGRKTVFVPYYAMSAGTIMSLAADEIVMGDHAALGPIDVQFHLHDLGLQVPTRAVLWLAKTKPKKRIDDSLLGLAEMCRRELPQHQNMATDLMAGTYSHATARRIVRALDQGDVSHGLPLTFSAARALGLKVSNNMPREAMEIVRAFRRPEFGQRSVLFCP